MLRIETRLKAVSRYARAGDSWKHMVPRSDLNNQGHIPKVNPDYETYYASGYDVNRMTLDHKFRPPYLYPVDDPRHVSWDRLTRAEKIIHHFGPHKKQYQNFNEMDKLLKDIKKKTRNGEIDGKGGWEILQDEYPTFTKWQDSWRDNYERAMSAKDDDDLAILDFERAEEKYNSYLTNYIRPIGPVEGRSFFDYDMWMNRLYGIPSRNDQNADKQQEYINQGEAPQLRKDMKFDAENISDVYSVPFYNKEAMQIEKDRRQMIRYRNKALSSKANHSFRVSHDGEANYDWRQVWPTPRSFRDPLVPFDVRQGVRQDARHRPTKHNNYQMNFSPNMLHLAPPNVKAHCKELKKFGTKFPEEYINNYNHMRDDFPIEIMTGSKCEAAPYQQSPDHEMRWATLHVQMGRLNLDETGKFKMKIFVEGRKNEMKTRKLRHYGIAGKFNKKQVIRRDLTDQDYRFGNDYYNPSTDMIQLESARCPLKHQNEGYLLYLLTQYWRDSARVLKFENRGEVVGGKFSYENSRADKTLKSVRDDISDELQAKIGDAVERLHNLESEGHKIRGQQGWERDANLAEGYSTCARKAALDDYSSAMQEAMLSDEQKASVYPDFDFQRVRREVDPNIKKKTILMYGGKREMRKKGFLTDDNQLNIPEYKEPLYKYKKRIGEHPDRRRIYRMLNKVDDEGYHQKPDRIRRLKRQKYYLKRTGIDVEKLLNYRKKNQ